MSEQLLKQLQQDIAADADRVLKLLAELAREKNHKSRVLGIVIACRAFDELAAETLNEDLSEIATHCAAAAVTTLRRLLDSERPR